LAWGRDEVYLFFREGYIRVLRDKGYPRDDKQLPYLLCNYTKDMAVVYSHGDVMRESLQRDQF